MTKGEEILSKTGADALFTTCEYLQRYLTGFSAEGGYVLVDKTGTTLYTDKRYLEAANAFFAPTDVKVKEIRKDFPPEKLLSAYRTVAIPKDTTTLTEYERLQQSGAAFVDATPAFCEARAIKSRGELSRIQLACVIADDAFWTILPQLKEGMTETQVAALLEYEMRKREAEGVSFDTIVAFGAHSAVPHHKTGDAPLERGDVVLIDFGCKVDGYCSDMTRTFLFGDDGKHEEFKKAYQAVLAAHEKVLPEVKSGMTAGEADAIARDYLEEKGYGQYFTHSLGHGIGLQIHEFPTLTKGKDTVLQEGMVFSDEPGVYIEGKWGIRIEDTVCVDGGKVKPFLLTKKDLIIL